MEKKINYRVAHVSDVLKLSILYQQVYIQTYGIEGVSDEFANFISRQFSVTRIESIIDENPDSIIVAEYKGNLVGVAETAFGKICPVGNIKAPELSKLYILEWFCGNGIGQRLLQETEKIILSRGIPEIWLWVLSSNDRAINFYLRNGYQKIGNAPFKMEVNTYDNWVMTKALDPV